MAMKDVVSERYDLGSPLTALIQIFPNEETLLGSYQETTRKRRADVVN